jgi:hypothetical protein
VAVEPAVNKRAAGIAHYLCRDQKVLTYLCEEQHINAKN